MASSRYIKGIVSQLDALGFDADVEDWTLVPFWGAAQEKKGVIDASCLSNHYVRQFEHQGNSFNSVEQGMMWFKASMFNDRKMMSAIMQEKWPPNQKRLGRQVQKFNTKVWDDAKYELVKALCHSKFSQHKDLNNWLTSHPKNVLFVEASPFDRIWGVELPSYAPEIKDIHQWQGENLLGFIHTENFQELSKTVDQ